MQIWPPYVLLWSTERRLYEIELPSKQEENFTSLAEARDCEDMRTLQNNYLL